MAEGHSQHPESDKVARPGSPDTRAADEDPAGEIEATGEKIEAVVRRIKELGREIGDTGGQSIARDGTRAEARGMSVDQAAREIERLREHRAFKGKNVSITRIVDATQKRSERVQRKLGELISLWEAAVPTLISERTKLVSLKGGVLHVAAESSAVSYELDRLLRGGLLVTLRGQYHGTLTRIKVRVGAVDSDK